MIIKLPPLESELFDTWEKHIAENPELINSPEEAKQEFEHAVDDFFGMIMLIATF